MECKTIISLCLLQRHTWLFFNLQTRMSNIRDAFRICLTWLTSCWSSASEEKKMAGWTISYPSSSDTAVRTGTGSSCWLGTYCCSSAESPCFSAYWVAYTGESSSFRFRPCRWSFGHSPSEPAKEGCFGTWAVDWRGSYGPFMRVGFGWGRSVPSYRGCCSLLAFPWSCCKTKSWCCALNCSCAPSTVASIAAVLAAPSFRLMNGGLGSSDSLKCLTCFRSFRGLSLSGGWRPLAQVDFENVQCLMHSLMLRYFLWTPWFSNWCTQLSQYTEFPWLILCTPRYKPHHSLSLRFH